MTTPLIHLGTLAGLQINARRSVLWAYPALVLGLSLLGGLLLRLEAFLALEFGAACALLHILGEVWHNLGHAAAARRAGFPMQGITFWGLLAASCYPEDEGRLTARVHIWRALGGPTASLLLTALAGLGLVLSWGSLSLSFWIALFFFLDNLLVYSLGAFLPLGFTDGSTLLYWLKRL